MSQFIIPVRKSRGKRRISIHEAIKQVDMYPHSKEPMTEWDLMKQREADKEVRRETHTFPLVKCIGKVCINKDSDDIYVKQLIQATPHTLVINGEYQ